MQYSITQEDISKKRKMESEHEETELQRLCALLSQKLRSSSVPASCKSSLSQLRSDIQQWESSVQDRSASNGLARSLSSASPLPVELVMYIIGHFISVSDWKNCFLVCTSWREAVHHLRATRSTFHTSYAVAFRTCYNHLLGDVYKSATKMVMDTTRTKFTKEVAAMLQGERDNTVTRITDLTVHTNKDSNNLFDGFKQEILRGFPNLRRFKIDSFHSAAFYYQLNIFSYLEHLDIEVPIHQLTNPSFEVNRFVIAFKQLKSLTLRWPHCDTLTIDTKSPQVENGLQAMGETCSGLVKLRLFDWPEHSVTTFLPFVHARDQLQQFTLLTNALQPQQQLLFQYQPPQRQQQQQQQDDDGNNSRSLSSVCQSFFEEHQVSLRQVTLMNSLLNERGGDLLVSYLTTNINKITVHVAFASMMAPSEIFTGTLLRLSACLSLEQVVIVLSTYQAGDGQQQSTFDKTILKSVMRMFDFREHQQALSTLYAACPHLQHIMVKTQTNEKAILSRTKYRFEPGYNTFPLLP